jgi:hypothetical protein
VNVLPLSLRRSTYANLRRVHKLVKAEKFDGRGLRKLGFVRKEVGGAYRTMYIFINYDLDIVLKYPAYLSQKRICNKFCIPTLFIKNPKKGKKLAVIQPLAELGAAYKICREFENLGVKGPYDLDLHENNVGSFFGYPILLDW